MKGSDEGALRSNSSNCDSNGREQEKNYSINLLMHRTRSDFEFSATRHTDHSLDLNLTGTGGKAETDAGRLFGSGCVPNKGAILKPGLDSTS